MKHTVFCACYMPKNEQAIKIARSTAHHLGNNFSLDEDVVECSYHSNIDIIEGKDNFEVVLKNNSIIQLIEDCMEWAVEYYKQKQQLKQ